jgi:hypothetical protein
VVTELVRPRGHKSNSGGPNAPRFANGNINWDEVYRKYLSDIMTNQRALNTRERSHVYRKDYRDFKKV